MNLLDLTLLAFVAAVTLAGFTSGFVRAATTLVGLVLGFVAGSICFPAVAPLFLRWTGRVAVAGLLAFTVIAVGVALLLDAIGAVAARVVGMLRLQSFDRGLGVLPAALSAVLIAGVGLAVLNGFAVLERERAESRLSGWFVQVSAPLVELLPPPWNGPPRKLPPRPRPTPDAPPLARVPSAGEPRHVA